MATPQRTILLVDDEEDILEIVADRLTFYGFAVRTAPDGIACLEAVRQAAPDLILLDLRIPRLDGKAVLARLRHICPGVPVVIISASSERDAAEEALAQGATAYLLKPFQPADLKKTVFQALQQEDP
jgi:CheY-like chemotaxis protein